MLLIKLDFTFIYAMFIEYQTKYSCTPLWRGLWPLERGWLLWGKLGTNTRSQVYWEGIC